MSTTAPQSLVVVEILENVEPDMEVVAQTREAGKEADYESS